MEINPTPLALLLLEFDVVVSGVAYGFTTL
jgi:hypothetical protein